MSQRRHSLESNNEQGTRVSDTRGNLNWKELDELLEDLPRGIPVLSPEDAGNFEKYTNRPRHVYAQGDGWKNCARALEKYDVELCKGHREEIDTLLVFAGLFSAVVTAFTIESYQWLQADANDAIVVLLSQIAQSVSPNGTAASLPPSSAGLPGSVSVRINVYWFLALALSLSAALVAILCKQWIREFERNMGLIPKEFVGIHQTKLDGLEKWRVGGIISLLPLLLQLALAVFAMGILELLWQLNSVVAIVVCVPTVVALIFYVITTLLPAIQYQYFKPDGPLSLWQTLSECPYKSPQAMLVFRVHDAWVWLQHTIVLRVSYLLSLARYHLATGLRLRQDRHFPYPRNTISPLHFGVDSWHNVSRHINYRLDRVHRQRDILRPTSWYRSLRWILWNLNDGDITEWVWHCIWETVSARDPDDHYDEDSLKQGLYYVSVGSTDIPESGLRALALAELSRTNAPHMFVLEAFIQNLILLDPAGAEYLTERIINMPRLRLDLHVAVSMLRAASAYARSHVHKAIGTVLLRITYIIILHFDAQAHMLHAYALMLYLCWLGEQPVPYQSTTVVATERAVVLHCSLLMEENEDYSARPGHLRQRPHVRKLAELLRIYVEMTSPSGAVDLVTALAERLFPASAEQMYPVVRELLDIASHGVGQNETETQAVASGACEPSISRTSSSCVHVLPDGAQPQDARTEPATPAPIRRDSLYSAGSHAHPAGHSHAPADLREQEVVPHPDAPGIRRY